MTWGWSHDQWRHVTPKCCEAVQSAILATSWLLVLIHLHQWLLLSSPNVDVNETTVELDIALKMQKCTALHPPPVVQMLQRGMWQPNQTEMSMTLRMMMMTMSDSGSTVHIIIVFVPCWAVWNHTISLLSNSMLALLWFHWYEREGGNFLKQSWLCAQCESKKSPPPRGPDIFHFFHKRLRIYNRFFTHLLNVPIFARLQILIQLSPILTKLCHIKGDYPVHIICAKCPKRVRSESSDVCVSRW